MGEIWEKKRKAYLPLNITTDEERLNRASGGGGA